MSIRHTLSATARIARGRLPGQLVIQMTDRCNGRCPQCEMRATNRFKRSSLNPNAIREMLDAAAHRRVAAVSFTGGEPLLMLDDLADLLRYAGRLGIPYLRTGTNGFFLREPSDPAWETRVRLAAETLADTPVRNFWISLDSVDPTIHDAMRGFKGLVKGIERAVPILNECGIYPSANLGINRNLGGEATARLEWRPNGKNGQEARYYDTYRNAFARFFDQAVDLGFNIVNVCYPMSLDPEDINDNLEATYAATSIDRIVRFTPEEKAIIFQALLDTVGEVRTRIRVFAPRVSIYVLQREYATGHATGHPCRGGIDFFFVDAKEGNTYPCGYRGAENLGKFSELNGNVASTPNGCRKCDWECFRDPSELLGPVLDLSSHPFRVARRLAADPAYRRYWLNDLRYYRACDYFHGRKPFDLARLRGF